MQMGREEVHRPMATSGACYRTLSALVLSVALGFTSCALFLSKESRYLSSVKDHATENDVKQHLGEPAQITSDSNRQTLWIYETRKYVQEGTNNAWTTIGSWRCETYSLTFDDNQILRDWTHAPRPC